MKKITLKLSVFLSVFLLSITTAFAYNPTLGGKLSRGVSNVCYTTNGLARNYSSYIDSAANNWVHTGWNNPIYMTSVSSTYATSLDIYAKGEGNNGTLAYTAFFNSSGGQMNPSRNYYFAEIHINDSIIRNYNVGGTLRHEMGHVFGMDENNGNPYSIMAQTWARKVQTVQKVDNDTINHLY